MNKAQQEYLEGILLRNTVHFPKGHTLTSSFDCLAYHDIHPIILHIIALGASEDSEQEITSLKAQVESLGKDYQKAVNMLEMYEELRERRTKSWGLL